MLSRVVFAASYFHWNGAFFFWFHCNGEITMRTMIHYSSNRCRRRTRSRNGNCIAWRRRWHTNEMEKVHRIRYKLNGSPARFTTFEFVLDVAFVWHIDMLQTRAQTPHISNELNWISKFQEQAENEKHKFDWRRTWNSLTLALQQQQPYCISHAAPIQLAWQNMYEKCIGFWKRCERKWQSQNLIVRHCLADIFFPHPQSDGNAICR